ncbi:MAG: FapA family protein, partial [Bacillota bacterium]|nr:FapA family protein [Bacillota bacterium]
VLAIKSAATPGEAGTNIMGEPIPARPGKDTPIVKGQGVEIINEGTVAVATLDGQPLIKDKSIHVLQIFEHLGDVDFSSGNLDFVGSIIIRGGVKNGFTVTAEGDVEVYDIVEGGNIKAGGSVQVKKGIQGRGKGNVEAEGDIVTKYIENCNVICNKSIYSEAIMHSNVTAKQNIIVAGKKGLLVGGICCAGEAIRAKTIGSSLATNTVIEVGVTPKLRKEYNETKHQLKEIESNLEKTKKALLLLKKLESQSESFSNDKQIMLLKVSNTHQQLEQMLDNIKQKKIAMDKMISEYKNGKLEAINNIYPGVSITIGRSILNITDELKMITLMEEAGEIKIAPYNPTK